MRDRPNLVTPCRAKALGSRGSVPLIGAYHAGVATSIQALPTRLWESPLGPSKKAGAGKSMERIL